MESAAAPPSGFYWCPDCDVYGRGSTCWVCGSSDVRLHHVPKDKVPTGGGFFSEDSPLAVNE